MAKKVIITVLIIVAIVIGIAAWYYLKQAEYPQIEKILSNPKAYEGKVITLEGEVTDRASFFVVVKFYKLKDESGEIIVVTKRTLPELRSRIHVKGRVDGVFPIGDQKLVVFIEESIEEIGRNK